MTQTNISKSRLKIHQERELKITTIKSKQKALDLLWNIHIQEVIDRYNRPLIPGIFEGINFTISQSFTYIMVCLTYAVGIHIIYTEQKTSDSVFRSVNTHHITAELTNEGTAQQKSVAPGRPRRGEHRRLGDTRNLMIYLTFPPASSASLA